MPNPPRPQPIYIPAYGGEQSYSKHVWAAAIAHLERVVCVHQKLAHAEGDAEAAHAHGRQRGACSHAERAQQAAHLQHSCRVQ
eukprot:6186725-Pleurochrysis_carterae.AAC.2